ncbi:MAG: thymidine kinase [Oscillospiraceae bacterium]|nr:thymidine kinase [Candidatus Limimonas coprohippi]MCQ2488882.1 thymidine kinase [Clostridia bacterium]
MAKLYFKFGAMGSSKTAQALMTKFNYEEKGNKVWLVKPSADTRDGEAILMSRIGLKAIADVIAPTDNLINRYADLPERVDVIICDECQFLTEEQVDQLKSIVDDLDVPVLCFGLRTDFRTKMFPGSTRLFEIADSITEIKSVCQCGKKATVNGRFDENGKIIIEGNQVFMGGSESYQGLCYKCYKELIKKDHNIEI